jgi:hypothetical protein
MPNMFFSVEPTGRFFLFTKFAVKLQNGFINFIAQKFFEIESKLTLVSLRPI